MKILHLEDNLTDAELIHELLREEWPDCAVTLVDNRADFAAQLGVTHDIILSDFTLASFNGLEALRLAREAAPGTPFVFVSGSIGEERAIEAVRNGAHDYVIKDRLKRLNTSIRRALGDAQESRRRREAEAARRTAEHRVAELADFINKSREAISVTDLNGRFTFWNKGAEHVAGWTAAEATGKTPRQLYGPVSPAADPLEEVLRTGEWRGESVWLSKAGDKIVMDEHITLIRDDSGLPQAFLRIASDITAKKKLEAQFLRVQRLETLGMLAAGIAHDLNNVLAPVSLGTPVLRLIVTDPRATKLIDAFEASAQRGSALVRQILTFARGAGGEHRSLDLAYLADELTRIIEQSFPPSIAIDSRWPDDLHRVSANPIQMHQVLLNLCVNARDAMPQGGTLSLRARNVAIPPGSAERAPGNYVRIEIGDTGTGIPPDVLERIWEPFFSTKKTDQGTGLGLSTVRGIIESHHGHIQVETAVGRGSTFIIHLPAFDPEAPALPAAPCQLCGQPPIRHETA